MMAKTSPRPLMLIPCAGYGTRVGKPLAKEMLAHPATGRPLIEGALRLARAQDFDVHLISRSEKTNLNDFVQTFAQKYQLNLTLQIVKPTSDWPETLLLSQPYWRDRNVVILPDTHWSPESAVRALAQSLEFSESAYAVFHPSTHAEWGWVENTGKALRISEKPRTPQPSMAAWGIMAFQGHVGVNILTAHRNSQLKGHSIEVDVSTQLIDLISFADLTRPEP